MPTQKSKIIFTAFLIFASQHSLASFNRFDFVIPTWLKALALGLAILALIPILFPIWMIGKKMIGLRLSKKDGGRLEMSGLFYLVYAVIYLLFCLGSLNLYQLSQFSAITQLYAPVLLALSIGFICRHVGRRIAS